MSAAGAEDLAAVLLEAYEAYVQEFHAITRRAPGRFERKDWTGSVADSLDRLRLYKRHIDTTVDRCLSVFDADAHRPDFWESARGTCRQRVERSYDADLALMFVDSVLRRALLQEAFVPYGADSVDPKRDPEILTTLRRTYPIGPSAALGPIVEGVLLDCGFASPFRDLAGDAALSAQVLAEALVGKTVDAIEVLRPMFYRNKGAYLVGRMRRGDRVTPLAFAFAHSPQGIVLDAVLTEESDLRRIFSYTRSNFHVEVEGHYRELLDFLHSIMPHKNWAALYSSIGFMNPAKIQLSKDLLAHRQQTRARLAAAWGIPGLVMAVFTPPGFPYVFKVIRDDDKVTKSGYIGRQGVRDKYRLVQEGDRVGRLLDTITFHHLRFARDDFEPKMLRELLDTASGAVKAVGDDIVITHCYAQREVTPLPIYLRQCDWPEAHRVLNDLGACIKDIAAAGLFSGEFDLKNFGVAEDGRVVFFDFDVLDELGKFSFDEVALEGSLGQEEIFEYLLHEYRVSLVDVFRSLHPDLFEPSYWRRIQGLLKQGEVLDTFPYPAQRRLESRRARARRMVVPRAVDAELDRLGLRSAHRRGQLAWETAGPGLSVGRSSWAVLSETQRAAVQEAFGLDGGSLARTGPGVIVIDEVPAFVFVPRLSPKVLDLSGHYAMDDGRADEWRRRVERELFESHPVEFVAR